MQTNSCPNPDELKSFVRCTISEQRAELISEHLEQCSTCEETVVGFERDGDTLADRIKAPAAQPQFVHEPECQRLMQSMLDKTSFSSPNASSGDAPFAMLQSLRDYQIVAKLGEGGMGAVYKAVHQRLKKTVALKVMPTKTIGDKTAVARFEREMEVLGQLNHPNIVQALDAGEHDGQHYLVMEYVEGSDLSDIARRCSPLSVADACMMISQAAAGLQYAHENGFVHRDIKPANLILARTGSAGGRPQASVKILDLGLARALEQRPNAAGSAELTSAGQVMGTLDYMAPEQGGDSHQVDIRADIYSLGATLYKLLTGESPFAEHAHKPIMQRLMAIAQNDPPPIRSKRADVPEKLAAVIHRLLAKKPEQRLATPADVEQALLPFCAGADLVSMLASDGATRILEVPSRVTQPAPSIATGVGSGSRTKTLIAGAAAILLLAAILVISTRYGQVEVTSPDGQLPPDVKVAVSRNGDEIELLQADNHWSAKLVNGEYQVALRGGEDRFELKQSKLQVSRFGKALLTVELLKTSPNVAKFDPAPDKQPPKATTNKALPRPAIIPAADLPPIAPAPETILPDRAKPFVVLSPEGKVLGEYKFVAEALTSSSEDLILEVHGNGPFKLPQIERKKCALTILAAKGYRPRFETGFDMPVEGSYRWLDLQEVELTVINCDFFARPKGNHPIFVGTGKQWTIRGCRLIQASNNSALLGFYGERLEIRDSFMANAALDLRPTDELSLVNNIYYLSPVGMGVGQVGIRPNQNQRVQLSSGLFYGADPLRFGPRATPTSRTELMASGNLFMPGSGVMVIDWQPHDLSPKEVFQWIGHGNRFAPLRAGPLWMEVADPKATKPPRTVEEWNTLWGHADDLTLVKDVRFEWDYLSLSDWTEGAKRFTKEMELARTKHPKLPILGPDMTLVGAGDAYDRIRNGGELPTKDQRPEPLEGGPFVLIREGKPPRGYLTLANAIADVQSGDEIEIRSDATFRKVHVALPDDKSLTLRAATGYRPVLTGAWLQTGNWSLEGLHLQHDGSDGFLSSGAVRLLSGAVRRMANCTLAPSTVPCVLQLPAGLKQPLEIINCYSSAQIRVVPQADNHPLGIKLDNSVVPLVHASSSDAGMIEVSRCCFWTHLDSEDFSGRPINVNSEKPWQVKVTDSLLDAYFVVLARKLQWQGERNLYRLHSGNWGAFEPPGGTDMWRRSLDEWRAIWNSDTDSESDDSAILRPELWRERKQ